MFEENASDTDVQSASVYLSSLPECNPKLHESELRLTEPAAYQLSATFKERYDDYLKLHHDCLHASDKLVGGRALYARRSYVPYLSARENRGQEARPRCARAPQSYASGANNATFARVL